MFSLTTTSTIHSAGERELERLEEAGIISPIQFLEWVTPIVSVIKQDGSVRICGDYKVMVNKQARLTTPIRFRKWKICREVEAIFET